MLPNWSLNALRMLREPVELRLGLAAAAARSAPGSISASSSASCDLHRRLLLDPVAVHVDRFEDALATGPPPSGAGSFGTRKFRKIDSFSHSALVYGRIDARKP